MRFLYFLLSSSTLIGLVLLLRKLLQKQLSAGMLYALWLIPLVRLMIPFGFVELPVFGSAAEIFAAPYKALAVMVDAIEDKLQNSGSTDKSGIAQTELIDTLSDDQIEGYSFTENNGNTIYNNSLNGSGADNVAEASQQRETLEDVRTADFLKESKSEQSHMALIVFAFLWLLGSLVVGLYAFLSNLYLLRGVSHMEETNGDCPLPVCCSDAVVSPCLFGLIHPSILINHRVKEDKELYQNVIRHELAHYQQKDHIWTFLRIFLCVLYWWHPLVWIGVSYAGEDAELACDARAIRNLSTKEKKSYGYSLLNLLMYAQNRRQSLCIATSMSGNKKSMKRRMEGITGKTVTRKYVLFPAVMLLLAAMLCGCSVPSAKSFVRAIGNEEKIKQGQIQVNCDFSLQEDIRSRLFYYEIYHYGKITERHLMVYGDLGDHRNDSLYMALERIAAEELPEEGYYATLEEGSASTKIKLQLTDLPDVTYGGSVLSADGKKRQVQNGDDLVLMAQFLQAPQEDSKTYTCEEMENATEEERGELLEDNYLTILIHMVLSDLPEWELSAAFDAKEYPALADTSESEQAVQAWATAFADRDGKTLAELMTEELRKQMEEDEMLSVDMDSYSFGWSSPWPMADNSYRILNCDGQKAEILYYAWVSDPHMYVWKETLTLEERDGEYKIASEELDNYTDISSAEDFYKAYPDGVITGTQMDYLENGMGEALNQNALENDYAEYQYLFDPRQSACYLLNLLTTEEGTLADAENGVYVSSEDTGGIARIQIIFPDNGGTVEVAMFQPYGADGIWIPETAGFVATDEGRSETVANTYDTEDREGFKSAKIAFVAPSWTTSYQDFTRWTAGELDAAAQKAIQELYNLTGFLVEECVYTTTGSGDYIFANSKEDMERSKIFYSRYYKNPDYEKSIPSMDLTDARKIGYSKVQQLDVPKNADSMDEGELAIWFLQHSGIYQGEQIVSVMPSPETDLDMLQVVLEDGAFYELQVDQELKTVSHIAGPYPKGFTH